MSEIRAHFQQFHCFLNADVLEVDFLIGALLRASGTYSARHLPFFMPNFELDESVTAADLGSLYRHQIIPLPFYKARFLIACSTR